MSRYEWIFWLGGIVFALLLGGGCDLPTGAPSVQTSTELSSPLVAEKTFSFLGGPTSEYEPLLDTARGGIDSLFASGGPSQTVYVEQEVSSFGIGSLNGILDEAARGMELDTSFSGPILLQNRIKTQPVTTTYERTNGLFESPGRAISSPVPADIDGEIERPFPIRQVVDPPKTDVVDATDATVESVVLTGEVGNTVTFTIENNQPKGTPLTNGTSGEAPEIALRDPGGADPLSYTSVGTGPIGPGTQQSLTVDLGGERFGTETIIALRIEGSGREDSLTIDTAPHLRYGFVTLSDPSAIRVEAAATGVETPAPTASRFAGLHVREGDLDVQIENQMSFPIRVEQIRIENNENARALLPRDFPALDVGASDGSTFDISAGGAGKTTFDLADRGVARRVDAIVRGTPAQTTGTVTLHADGGLRTVGEAEATISKMHFWPEGERIHAEGELSFSQKHVKFERDDDFVEFASGRVQLHRLKNELGVGFESFTLSYPDVRRQDANNDGRHYAAGDSLVIALVENPEGPYEFEPLVRESRERNLTVPFEDLRLLPQDNTLPYHLRGTMVTASDTTAEQLRVLRIDQEIRSDMTFDQLDVRAVRGTVNPFSANVTPDVDGNGRLDVADDNEVQETSFRELEHFAQHIEGLELEQSRLTLSAETDVGANLRFYGALQGRHRGNSEFLAGRESQRVSPSSPVANDFQVGSSPIAARDLIQFDVEGAPSRERVSRSLTMTESNSTIDAFLSQLPTRVRMAAKVQVQSGRLHLRRPVAFDLGLGLRLPVSFNGSFTYRDTLDADLDGLEAFTDPGKNVSMTTASLQIRYANAFPIGIDVGVTVVDESGGDLVSLPGPGETVTLKPAPKTDDGAAATPREGTLTLDLSEDEVRALARGNALHLQFTMGQETQGPAARLRADDTIQLSVSTDIDATVQVGD